MPLTLGEVAVVRLTERVTFQKALSPAHAGAPPAGGGAFIGSKLQRYAGGPYGIVTNKNIVLKWADISQ